MKTASVFLVSILAVLTALSAIADDKRDAIASAIADVRNGNHADAIAALSPHAGSDDWDVHYWLGSAYLLDGKLEDASRHLDSALSIEPERIEAWVQRAVVEQEAKRPEVAIELLQVALDLDPGFPLIHLNRGYAFEMLGRPDAAASAYRSFLSSSVQRRLGLSQQSMVLTRLASLAQQSASE